MNAKTSQSGTVVAIMKNIAMNLKLIIKSFALDKLDQTRVIYAQTVSFFSYFEQKFSFSS